MFNKPAKANVVAEGKVGYKKFQEAAKARQEYFKNKKQKEEERIDELKGKVTFDVKALPEPIPADIDTFQRTLKLNAKDKDKGTSNKGNGMGVGPRMPLSEKERWVKKVERYNINASEPIDAKKDPAPAPNSYSLISYWPGKKMKKRKAKENEEKLPNILSKISKGPIISVYYAKHD